MRSAFAQTNLPLMVGLLSRYIGASALMAGALMSTRADGYLWQTTWQNVLLLFILNTCMCVLAVLLNISSSKLRRAGLWQRTRPVLHTSRVSPLSNQSQLSL
jgi:hypothetical protein